MAIRSEQTGTEELIKDGLFLWASLLSDPETEPLAKAVRQEIDKLKTADLETREAEEAQTAKWAQLQRAEFGHDDLQRECELDVFKAVKKDRKADAYRSLYPDGLSALVQLSGKEQERAVQGMLKGLLAHHPDLAKQYQKELSALARKATQAEDDWAKAQALAAQAFQGERLARSRLVRAMQRTEGSLLAQFPGNRTRVRSYFRDHRRTRDSEPAEQAPSPAPAAT